jgi:serine protease Do
MEELKKLLVIVTGVVLIGLIIYFALISSNQDLKPQFFKDDSTSERIVVPDTIPRDSLDISTLTTEPEKAEVEKETERDSINWHQLSEENKELKSKREIPKPSFNPNKLFTNAAKLILPAVVSIQSTQVFRFIPEDHPDFFHPGSGSGIIISSNGYILTNFHVVNEARDLHIVLYDHREFPAEYVGSDPTTDIAVLKIEAEDLPVAYMGNSENIEIGEWVLAVGNPLNFASTITAGIISAVGRDINIIDEDYRIENFIQTDAVINPGNSGGALVNLSGELIGINTAIATKTGFNQGYGFAIPVNLAKKVANDIVRFGHVKRGLLGISIGRVTSSTARAMGLEKPIGVFIQGVTKDFPAEKVGLRQGDIILSVNGEVVNAPNELQMKIANNHPGTKVKLNIWRDGQENKFEVVLAEAPISETKSFLSIEDDEIQYENLGLKIRNLTQTEKDYLETNHGVLVEKVYTGSPAQYGGIFQGDVILSIDEKMVNSKTDIENLIKNAPSGIVLKIQIRRKFGNGEINNRIVFVEVP